MDDYTVVKKMKNAREGRGKRLADVDLLESSQSVHLPIFNNALRPFVRRSKSHPFIQRMPDTCRLEVCSTGQEHLVKDARVKCCAEV